MKDMCTGSSKNNYRKNHDRNIIIGLVRTIPCLLVILGWFAADVQAAYIYWEGDHPQFPSQWSEAGNWSLGLLPDVNDIAVLDSYVTGQPVMDVSDAVGELWLHGGTGTITLDINGKILTVTSSGGLSGNVRVYLGGTIDFTDSNSKIDCESFLIENSGTVDGTDSTASILCRGNWTDNGTFHIGNTTVTMNAIGGTPGITSQNTNDFYNLVIDSTVTVSLNSDIDVDNRLTVQGGKLDVSTYTLTVE